MKKLLLISSASACFVITVATLQESCTSPAIPADVAVMTPMQMVEHGRYLTNVVGGCNDCHSPKIMTQQGPMIDTNRRLSGSPDGMPLAAIDTAAITPGKWYLGSADLTAWVGPWGVSYSANLTPDTATGLGGWTEETFLKALHTGKERGIEAGRPIMPPMPWDEIGKMTDQDLKCIFAYLKTLKPIKNRVHDYVPPPMIASMNGGK